jgi:dCMP deaminase
MEKRVRPSSRPTRESVWLEVAGVFARRSTCSRLKVGCVVTDEAMLHTLGSGYNGSARGLPNHCETTDAGKCGCLHAELNALLKAPGIGPKRLFTTVSPCVDCAKAALNTHITDVYYETAYRDPAGLKLLDMMGVKLWTLNADAVTRFHRVTFTHAGALTNLIL